MTLLWPETKDQRAYCFIQNCKIVFNYPRDRSFCAGAWSYSEHAILLLLFLSTLVHESKFHYYRGWGSSARMWLCKWISISILAIYITLIEMELSEYNAAFLCYCWFLFILFWGSAADMQIWALPTRSQCRVFDTQLTVKALGPHVS